MRHNEALPTADAAPRPAGQLTLSQHWVRGSQYYLARMYFSVVGQRMEHFVAGPEMHPAIVAMSESCPLRKVRRADFAGPHLFCGFCSHRNWL